MKENHLNDKLMECISSPMKLQILLEIAKHEQVTAKQLSEKCVDIPQTTLYRNLKKMMTDGLLKIVSETQIRGTVEKTYALAFDISDPQSILSENSGPLYMQLFMQYLLVFAKQFQEYCSSSGIDIKNDMTGFSLSHVYVSDKELTDTVKAISKILNPLQDNKPTENRKLRTIGLIVSPERKQ